MSCVDSWLRYSTRRCRRSPAPRATGRFGMIRPTVWRLRLRRGAPAGHCSWSARIPKPPSGCCGSCATFFPASRNCRCLGCRIGKPCPTRISLPIRISSRCGSARCTACRNCGGAFSRCRFQASCCGCRRGAISSPTASSCSLASGSPSASFANNSWQRDTTRWKPCSTMPNLPCAVRWWTCSPWAARRRSASTCSMRKSNPCAASIRKPSAPGRSLKRSACCPGANSPSMPPRSAASAAASGKDSMSHRCNARSTATSATASPRLGSSITCRCFSTNSTPCSIICRKTR